jgi:hypothetical protein
MDGVPVDGWEYLAWRWTVVAGGGGGRDRLLLLAGVCC